MKKPSLENIRTGLGAVGMTALAAALLGTGFGIAGLIGIGLKKDCAPSLLHFSGLLIGGGMVTVGAVKGICEHINDLEWEATMDQAIASTISKQIKSKVPTSCVQCKYFSKNIYLPCAVNPNLNSDCVDWEGKNN